jgi:hypothetical protein
MYGVSDYFSFLLLKGGASLKSVTITIKDRLVLKLLSAVLAVLLVGCASIQTTEAPVTRQAVHSIELPTLGTICSGVMIAPNKMLSAAHCSFEGIQVNGTPAVVLKKDTQNDLLLLLVNKDCPCVVMAGHLPKDGAIVDIIGYPAGLMKIRTTGIFQGEALFSNPSVPELYEYAIFSANVEGGYSGGGIFDPAGNLIAIVSAGTKTLLAGPQIYMIKRFLE